MTKAVFCEDLHSGGSGAFKPYKTTRLDPAGLQFRCPCGCDLQGAVTFGLGGSHTWNGDLDQPTVDGEIIIAARGIARPEVHWRGTLTDGVWSGD